MAYPYQKRAHNVPASHPRKASTVVSPEVVLHIAVDDYKISAAPQNGLTLVFTHGTSFNKAFWELVVNELLQKPGVSSRIKRVLALDAANHGDSAVANKGRLARDQTFWPDHSRDILKVMEYFQVDAPVIGIGHSFGGGTLSHAAMMAPEAFAATIFVEPIIFQLPGQTQNIAKQALKRRDRWGSYAEAKAAFMKSRGMSDWHSEQLQKYVDTAIYEVESEGEKYWTLKTTKEQEAATYLAAPYRAIPELLATSRQRHHFILGKESKVINADARNEISKISKSPEYVKTLDGVGHLVPMTHPHLLAEELAAIIGNVVGSRGCAKL
ncbi:Alpha/beta hydrolase family-domain-containing protein [Macrophomina phaseolina]|uniref:Alpha/beta hydrolase family-domain-containing protein n=1 Tax=Macrophomina phaseolina TaxID=35725 RepID=A0ABQ8GBQ5_9PEZI|nr:Alpha/beta hydrolase family-domain-containing protein [Macrophomina phaseolina]